MKTITKELQASITPQMAVQMLKDGNTRFVDKAKGDRDLNEQVSVTSQGQYPFAVVLSCIDSRVPVEHVFDLGIGDVFSARVAGNVINEDVLGSIEYGCKVAGSKLLLVMGHTKCGAVTSACNHIELGNITALLNKIQPAVNAVENDGEVTSEYIEKVNVKNVLMSIDQVRNESPILKDMEASGEIMIVGAVYNVDNGSVTFL
jgi:carbonic anhydrase